MATLTSLPNELLILIFSNVADDIRAGNITTTVGSVSKSFRRLIQSCGIDVLYTSLRGVQNMRNFLNLIRDRDFVVRKVYSLLLVVDCNESSDEDASRDIPLIETILSTINASRLHTLFIHVPPRSGTPILQFPVPLPSLNELRLSGLVANSPAGHAPYTPNVKRFQLLRLPELREVLEHRRLPRLVHDVAPNLTQLKFTIRKSQSTHLLDVLLFMTAMMSRIRDSENCTANTHPHLFPASLKQIVLTATSSSSTDRLVSALPLFRGVRKVSEQEAEVCRAHGGIPPLVVELLDEGDHDRVSGRYEEAWSEAEYVEGFAGSWMRLNVEEGSRLETA
ncbi:hypothetical protein EIP91_004052 [Steccherinum ochraceum]|uniref:F-box domain-containing protein n=1 Tax=Steccherinum ochraceum TaxID=92696 RepID=A0A4R0RKX9_9APHY|nr:hypothetical protein EIP91_004052 [Steccherinum ochraceum]